MPEPKSSQPRESASAPLVSTRRLNVAPWARPGDRQICLWADLDAPERSPHVLRLQTAGARLSEVDRTSTAVLLCNGLHEGSCRWPSGVVARTIDEEREARVMAEALAAADDSPRRSASPRDEAPPRDPTPPRRR